MPTCPLCFNSSSISPVKGPGKREFHCCDICKLIFTDISHLPAPEEEEKRYREHNNGIEYPGYVNFLLQAIEPAIPFLTKNMRGLDYGCGPMPTLSVLLEKRGYGCKYFDPFFFPTLPGGPYDFVFATECFEHFFKPGKEIECIKSLLRPAGYLIVMTETWNSVEAFSDWYYAKDFTHVSFYHTDTFRFVSERYGFALLECSNPRIILMQNKAFERAVL